MGVAVLASALVLTLPWLAGGLTGVSLMRTDGRAARGAPFIAFGAASALSLPSVGWLTWLWYEFGYLNFNYVLVGTSIACIIICGLIILNARPYSLVKPSPGHCIALALLMVQLLLCSWLAISSPLHGWDSLSHWGPQAHLIAEQIEAPAGTVKIAHHSHPPTVSMVLAWGAVVKNQIGHENALFNIENLSWVLCFFSIVIIIFGWGAKYYQRCGVPLLFCYFTASIPLLQNHSMVAGYSEIFVTVFFLIGAIYGCYVLERLGGINCATLVAAIVTLFYLRNTGLVLAATIIASVGLFLARMHITRGRFFFLLFFAVVVLTITILKHGWIIEFRGLEYGFDVDSGKIAIATYRHALKPPGLDVMIDLFEMAFIKNMSFGLIGVVTLISLGHFFLRREKFAYPEKMLVTLWAFLFLVTILSLFLPHGLQHSMPYRDTYLSRSLLPFIIISVLLVISVSAKGIAAKKGNSVVPFNDRDLPKRF